MTAARSPSFITFTGADDHTCLFGMAALSARYPIEWGILFSPKRQGIDQRYPGGEAQSRLMWSGLRMAGHLCGDHSRAIMEGRAPDVPVDLSYFDRIQVNHDAPEPAKIRWFARGWSGKLRGVAQSRGDVFPADDQVDWLFDCSGGRGAAPAARPAHPGRLVGYAGGINPGNVAAVVEALGAAAPYWIDMESGVRTDDRFDLAKCLAVCQTVYGVRP